MGRQQVIAYAPDRGGSPSAFPAILPAEDRSARLASGESSMLAGLSLFAGMDPAAADSLRSGSVSRNLSHGAAIFRNGDDGASLFVVSAGIVRISRTTGAGRGVVFNLVGPGDIFGEVALLDGSPRTADATAVTDCDLIEIDGRAFLTLMRTQPQIAPELLQVLCRSLRRTTEQFEDIVSLDVEVRLAKALLSLAERGALSDGHGIACTQNDLSLMVGASRETTNRQLRSWAARQWIRLERKRIVVLAAEPLARIAARAS
jgi:CRP/FNR family transcriptional regulator, cyclic AMP receptor protein